MSTAVQHDAAESCDAPGPPWRDWLLALAAVLILTDLFDAVSYRAFGRHTELLPGLPMSRALLLPVFAAAALLLAADLRAAAACIRAAWLLWPAVALAFVSALWSDQPRTTLLWAAALLGTSALGVALAARFSPRAQCELIAAATATAALGSVLAVLWWPAVGIAPRNGMWRGLYVHKNVLGKIMALGVAAAAVVALGGRRRAPAVVALLLCGGLILPSQSRASLLVAAIALAAAALLLAARRWRRHAAAILVSGAALTGLAAVLLVTTEPGLRLVARSDTFSNRTRIWRGVVHAAAETPWLGRGYAAFWPGPAGHEALAIARLSIGHAHNGFVDLYAELGIVGLVFVCTPLALFAMGAVRHAVDLNARACIWPATFLVYFAASNAAESPLLRHKLGWALYVAVACHLARHRTSPSAAITNRTP